MVEAVFWLCVATVVYVYFGYPFLVGLLGRVVRYTSEAGRGLPEVTLIIPAYNEEAVIGKKLDNSLKLDYPEDKLHILVVADGSDDGTAAIVQSYRDDRIRLLHAPCRQGKSAALNRAIAETDSEILVFSDANNLYPGDTLKQLVAPFGDATVGAVSGAKVILKGAGALSHSEGLYWRYESYIKKMETLSGCCTCLVGEVYAVRRTLVPPWPAAIINDDSYIALMLLKNGARIVYNEAARSLEHVSPTARDEITRRSRIIAGRLQIMALLGSLMPWQRPLVSWQLLSHKFLRPFVPFAMIGALAANGAIIILPDQGVPLLVDPLIYGLLGIGQVAFYAAALAANSFPATTIPGKALYLPKYLLVSNYATLIGWYRFLFGKQTPLWDRIQRLEVE